MGDVLIKIIGYVKIPFEWLQKYAGTLGLPSFDWTVMAVLFLAVAVFVIGFAFGKSRMLIGLLSLYVADVLTSRFVYFEKLHETFKNVDESWLKLGLFLMIFIIAFLLLQRSILRYRLSLSETSIFSVLLLCVLTVGFALSSVLADLPKSVYSKIPAGIIRYISTKEAHFWWAVAPIAALLFMKKKRYSGEDD